jgi:hypothetical protein
MRLNLLAAALLLSGYAHAQGSTSYQFERPAGTAEATLKVLTAQGKLYQQQFAAGQPVLITARLPDGTALSDGTHQWEISFAPTVSSTSRSQALSARENGNDQVPAGWPEAVPLKSGSFFIQGGQFQPMLIGETDADTASADGIPTAAGAKSGPANKDQVVADDFIAQGSICAGFDCINNENFGADTLRLKENNLRINFDDTSSTGSFPSRDWRLTANDQNNGGLSRFSIEDVTGGLVPFTVAAAAPNNALYVSFNGKIGIGTSTPVLDLHVVTGNTPSLRLDQSSAGGFSPQTWDVGGNEANFFIRDITGGSKLPLRIRPGAPTSSLDIEGSGDIGMGIASPLAALHVRRNADQGSEPWLLIDRSDDGDSNTEDRRLELDKDGNLFVSGSITQLSSRTSKTGFVALAGDEVLARLSSLPIWTWNYLTADSGDRHIGPVAEDFYAAFGFGRSERSLAPGDVAGVALAATKALQIEVAQRDQRISELEARLARLEAALEQVEDRAQAPR